MKKFVVLLFLFVTVISFGQQFTPEKYGIEPESTPSGLNVGEKVPDFEVKKADGKKFQLYEKLKSGPVVLIFYRGYWCPVCTRYLSAYQDSIQLILDIGVSFIAITPETYDFIEKTREESNAQFEILSDTGGKIMKTFHIDFRVTQAYQDRIQKNHDASIAMTNGQKEAALPVPATYIIDRNGTIVYRQFDLNYRNRASVREIIDHLP